MKAPLPANIFVPSHRLAKGFAEFLADVAIAGGLPSGCVGFTEDFKPLFRGDVLFELKDTHGFPLDFALDRIMSTEKMAVDWVAFIEAARARGWWDFQTYDVISHALVDAQIPRPTSAAILDRFKRYALSNPHPKMAPV